MQRTESQGGARWEQKNETLLHGGRKGRREKTPCLLYNVLFSVQAILTSGQSWAAQVIQKLGDEASPRRRPWSKQPVVRKSAF